MEDAVEDAVGREKDAGGGEEVGMEGIFSPRSII